MEQNRTSTKSVPFFVAPVSEPEFGQDLVRWGTCMISNLLMIVACTQAQKHLCFHTTKVYVCFKPSTCTWKCTILAENDESGLFTAVIPKPILARFSVIHMWEQYVLLESPYFLLESGIIT